MATRVPPLDLGAWNGEPELADEARFSSLAPKGWSSWNNMSPEIEFCETAAQLVRMTRPKHIIETGMGQGFVTRRVAAAMPDGARYVCYESYRPLRDAVAELPFFAPGRPTVLAEEPSPPAEALARADLTILDSGNEHRSDELRRWWTHGAAGAHLLVHDTGTFHRAQTPHKRLAALIDQLGIPGVFFNNPRGSFLGQKR